MDSRSHNQIRSHFPQYMYHILTRDINFNYLLIPCAKKETKAFPWIIVDITNIDITNITCNMLDPALYNSLRKKIESYEILAPSSSRLELCPQYKVDTKINDSTGPNYKFFERTD